MSSIASVTFPFDGGKKDFQRLYDMIADLGPGHRYIHKGIDRRG